MKLGQPEQPHTTPPPVTADDDERSLASALPVVVRLRHRDVEPSEAIAAEVGALGDRI